MSFLSLMKARTVAGLLFLVVALSACTVVVEDDFPWADRSRPWPALFPAIRSGSARGAATTGRPSPMRALPMPPATASFAAANAGAPMMAARSARANTIPSARVAAATGAHSPIRVADQAGYRVLSRGECRAISDTPRACTREYVRSAPVGAARSGHSRTACEADAAGFRVRLLRSLLSRRRRRYVLPTASCQEASGSRDVRIAKVFQIRAVAPIFRPWPTPMTSFPRRKAGAGIIASAAAR